MAGQLLAAASSLQETARLSAAHLEAVLRAENAQVFGDFDGEAFWALQLRWLPTAEAVAVNV